jgi:hypothetical protein
MFLELATGIGDNAVFALLVELRQNCAQPLRLFVISKTGIYNE